MRWPWAGKQHDKAEAALERSQGDLEKAVELNKQAEAHVEYLRRERRANHFGDEVLASWTAKRSAR